MRREWKKISLLVIMVSVTVMAMFLPGIINAGSLEPTGSPGSTMKTLEGSSRGCGKGSETRS